MKGLIPADMIERRILLIRGYRVMLSPHLAEMYGVEVRTMIQAVKRNLKRFPPDFMFQLADGEYENLKSRFVISSWGGSRRARPYAFTEQGVAMLSSVLRSDRAVQVNIAIMRVFVSLRNLLLANRELAEKLSRLEKRVGKHGSEIRAIFAAIHQLMAKPELPKKRIGFTPF